MWNDARAAEVNEAIIYLAILAAIVIAVVLTILNTVDAKGDATNTYISSLPEP